MFAVPQQKNAVNINPDFIDLSNPSTNHGLNDGLVLHARFIPRLFNTELYPDLSSQQNDLTLANVASSDLLADFENGRWGYLDCDGTSGQYGYCPLSDSLELTQLTFAGWVYITGTGIRAILEKREGTTSAWSIYSNDRVINIAGSDRTNNVAVTGTLTVSTWYHIVVTLDSSGNAKGYINGALSLSATTDAPGSQPTFPVILGARWDNIGTGAVIRPFQGRLDGIRLYNRVLSASEIADLYRQELAFNPDTIARFNPISLLSYSQDVGPFASIQPVGLVNQNPDFIDLSNPINWDHPLARHLKHLWLATPQYNGGLTFIDLCDPASYGTLTNMDGSNWVQLSENGQFAGLQFDGATEYVDFSSANDVPTTSTESFTCAYIARKTDSSSGTKLLNASGGTTGGYSAGLGWTDSAGRGFAIAVPTLGGVSISQKQIHVAGTPHTTFDNLWHFIGFNYPGGVDLNVDDTVIRWVIDGVTYSSVSGVGFGASGNLYRIGGRGTTAGWPGIIACHALWIPAIGPELLAEFEVEAESGYPNLLNRIPALPFTYSLDLSPPVVIPYQENIANQNPDFIDFSNPIASHGLNDGLVSWWLAIPNQMGTTTWKDLCGRYDGTLTNMDPGTDWLVENEDGRWGSLDFDGINDYAIVTSDTNVMNATDDMTVVAVVRSTSNTRDEIISKEGSTATGWSFAVQATNQVSFGVFGSSNYNEVLSISTINTSDFYHVAGVRSQAGNYLRVFINGVLDNETTLTSVVTASNRGLYIGINSNIVHRFQGQIASVKVYLNRALSATEVQELYNESRTYYPNLLNRIPSLLPVSVSEASGGAYSLSVDSQSITVTGTDSSLLYDRILSVDSGSFTLTGTAVTLNKGFTLVVDSQAITVTGTDVGVFYNRSLSVDSQSITVTGTDASTFYNRAISGESGSVTLSGTAVTLTVSGAGNYSITADGKAIALSPTDASLLFNRQISVDTIEITITGTDASVFHNRVIRSESGIVTLVGQDSSLLADRILSADSDSLTITGTDAGVFYNRSLSADGGSFTVSASDVSLLYDRILSADSQAITVVGTITTLQYSEDIGVYVYTASIAITQPHTAEISLSFSHTAEITVEIDG